MIAMVDWSRFPAHILPLLKSHHAIQNLRRQPRIFADTSDFTNIDYGDIIHVDNRYLLVVGYTREGRFGIDDQPKQWVPRVYDLESGAHHIVKLVFYETYAIKLGELQVTCYRSPEKEAKVIELTQDNPAFMQGYAALDEANNLVRILDVVNGKRTGIQLLNVLKKRPKVVLTTAYDQYALKAFDLEVADYLLKPISFERFVQSVEKVYTQIHKPSIAADNSQTLLIPEPSRPSYMFVKTEYRMQRINFDDILYIEGLKEYLVIHLPKCKVLTLQNFKRMEEMLPESNFTRVHKSYIVALDKIESIERNRIKIGDKLIPIGESFSKNFYTMLSERKLY